MFRQQRQTNQPGNADLLGLNDSTLQLLNWSRGCSLPGFTPVSPSTDSLYSQASRLATLAPRATKSVAAKRTVQDGYTPTNCDSGTPRTILGTILQAGTLACTKLRFLGLCIGIDICRYIDRYGIIYLSAEF